MQVGENTGEPEVELLPRVLNTPSRLSCRFGWDARTTAAFQSLDFEELQLRGGPSHAIHLPSLGKKAADVKRMLIAASGTVSGLQQFSNVETLDMPHRPKTGGDIASFPKLKSLFLEWNAAYASGLSLSQCLVELGLMGFPAVNRNDLEAQQCLRALSVSQGTIRALEGLEKCTELADVSLAYLRKFDDMASLRACRRLEKLSITNVPKLKGTLMASWWPALKRLYVVGTGASVDLSQIAELRGLEQLWVAVAHTGPDWEKVFALPRLMTVGLMEGPSGVDDQDLHAFAAKSNRRIARIEHAGRRGSRQVQITMAAAT